MFTGVFMSINFDFLSDSNIFGNKVPDNFQIRAIKKQDNTVVAAGAGSGKTEVLALRYISLLLTNEDLHVENILALTFTDKAASEIYERIYKRLVDFAEKLDENKYPTEKKLAKRALVEFGNAKIQTLDSYSCDIVRLAANRYGLSPDFTICGSSALTNVSSSALPFVIMHKDEPCFKIFSKAGEIESFASSYFDNAIQSTTSLATKPGKFSSDLKKQLSFIVSRWNTLISGGSENIESCLDELDSTYYALANEKHTKGVFSDTEVFIEIRKFLDNKIDCVILNENNFSSPENIRSISEHCLNYVSWTSTFNNVKLNKSGGKREEIKNAVNKLREYLSQLNTFIPFIINYNSLIDLHRLLDEFLEQVNFNKRKSGMITFNDVSELALLTLKEQTDIRQMQKKIIRKIMIDEFQDNNEKNRDLLFMISEIDNSNIEYTDNNDELFFANLSKNISRDKLFFVGDEKQSIYRFRGADVSVFNKLKNELTDNEGNVNLYMTNNYRSNESLLASFNKMFGNNDTTHIGANSVPSIFYSDSPLQEFDAAYPEKSFATHFKNDISSFHIDENNVNVHACIFYETNEIRDAISNSLYLSKTDTEAFFIAKKISEIIRNEKCSYSDFAILDKSRTNRKILQKYLTMFNIPFVVDCQTSVFNEGIVNDIYNFLRLCVYPNDTIAFASFLASPFVNMSQQGVKNILATLIYTDKFGEEFSPFLLPENKSENDFNLSPKDKFCYDKAKELYFSKKNIILSQSITSTLEFLWHELGYYYETILNNDTFFVAEQYDLLFEVARNCELEGKSISNFVDGLASLKMSENKSRSSDNDEINIKEITYPIEKPDAISIMTIHKSKGLQFKHVFVMGLFSKKQNESASVLFNDKLYGTGVSFSFNGKNFFLENQKEIIHDMNNAEFKRLIYVAITRAETDVYIVGSIKENKTRAGNVYSPDLSLFERLVSYYYPCLYDDLTPVNNDNITNLDEINCCMLKYFNKDYDAPFNLIRISPLPYYIRQLTYSKVNLDKLRDEKIDQFKNVYSLSSIEESDSFPKSFIDLTCTPSALEEAEHKPCNPGDYSSLTQNPDYRELSKLIKKETNRVFDKDIDPEKETIDSTSFDEFNAGDFGTMAHSYMECFINNGTYENTENSNQFDRIIAKKLIEVLPKEVHEKLSAICKTMCSNFEKSDFGKQIILAKNSSRLVKAENKFKMNCNDVIFTGSIDLLYENEDSSITIVDYKTDEVIHVGKYFEQLGCYRNVVSELYGIPKEKIKTFLYYLRYDKGFDISEYTNFTEEELKEIALSLDSSAGISMS